MENCTENEIYFITKHSLVKEPLYSPFLRNRLHYIKKLFGLMLQLLVPDSNP